MVKKCKVLVINDHKSLNQRYRRWLCDYLENEGFYVRNEGLFDGVFKPFLIFFEILWLRGRGVVVSSNIKCNIFFLLQPWAAGLVILNGMGRMRRKRVFRSFLLFLINRSSRKSIAVQSYADFRYFRRFLVNQPNLFWVPGSGGVKKKFGVADGLVSVQRDTKLPLVASSLKELLLRLDFDGCFYMVGCEREGLAGRLLNNGRVDVVEVGFVPQDEIFYLGNVFVQPSGYGEGFPHTLADALVSDMRVIIDKGEYLKYGLWKMDCDAKMIAQGWLEVVAGSEAREKVSAKAVLSLYVSAFYSTSCFSEGV